LYLLAAVVGALVGSSFFARAVNKHWQSAQASRGPNHVLA
jgi:hypothetical protein